MPYLIEGNETQVFTDFGRSILLGSGARKEQIEIDVPRTRLLGTVNDCKKHCDTWLNSPETKISTYSQGRPEARHLINLFLKGLILYPFCKPEELKDNFNNVYENIKQNCVDSSFAYVDSDGKVRGLFIYYRKDDPS